MDTAIEPKKVNVWKWIGLGLGIPAGALLVLFTGLIIFFGSGPEGGVRVGSNMEDYALEYLEGSDLLESDEKVVAYYDATVALNSSEAVILTNDRVIYHKNDTNSVIPLSQIERIEHEEQTLVGDVIQVFSKTGEIMVIEIAPLNNGKLFLSALQNQVDQL
ncbi:MAG: PH domain-containing protein [Cyanobacteria bacterium Co-bin8]|nr:PH domain-containing protein [Cyanobacteria bacterium Co-bin8]